MQIDCKKVRLVDQTLETCVRTNVVVALRLYACARLMMLAALFAIATTHLIALVKLTCRAEALGEKNGHLFSTHDSSQSSEQVMGE